MTENEAIKEMSYYSEEEYGNGLVAESHKMAILALEEIQQYRALEEKLNGITVKDVVEHFIKTVENQTEEEYIKGRILTNKEAEEWEQLKVIGSAEELQVLKAESVLLSGQAAVIEEEAVLRFVNWVDDHYDTEIHLERTDEYKNIHDIYEEFMDEVQREREEERD